MRHCAPAAGKAKGLGFLSLEDETDRHIIVEPELFERDR